MREAYRTRRVAAHRKKQTLALVVWELLLSCGHKRDFSTTKAGIPSIVRCFHCGANGRRRAAKVRHVEEAARGAS